MDDSVFHIVVAVGVGLAALAFIIQAFVVLALYRAFQKTQAKMEALSNRIEPVVHKAQPVIERLGPMLDRFSPVIEKLGPAVDKAGSTIEKIGPVLENTKSMLATANRILEETRPRISEVSEEVAGIARSGREQVERIGGLVTEAGGIARSRMEQIDAAVDNTVEHVEQAGDAVKRAVMKPVREVNGVAAGISAAVATLVKGRKSSVDTATQDEEMFI